MITKFLQLSLITLFLFSISSNSQTKRDLLKEIKVFKADLVSNASFDKDFVEVWDAMYIVANEEYNTIARESESRGYIDAALEKDTYREYMTVEIRGKDAPYRVSFKVKQERRTKNTDGSYSNWQSFTSSTLRSYYIRIKTRLYELLNGPIELPEKLQSKIDTYNAKQNKERKKITRGSDY